jgi:hypothetical protein
MLFAAVQESGSGTSRQLEATHGVGRYWGILLQKYFEHFGAK